jgi:hypothetical protein
MKREIDSRSHYRISTKKGIDTVHYRRVINLWNTLTNYKCWGTVLHNYEEIYN